VIDRRHRPARYQLTFHKDIEGDLAALDDAALDAAQAILDDLAHGRVTGKALGLRHVSGDLTGLARVKFDIPDQRPQRFRLLYRQTDSGTLDVLAIGVRDEHGIYRAAVARLNTPPRPDS
jgi:hypothetical protein